MTESRTEQIRRRLHEAFQPQELLIKDQSQLHVGHEGAKDGKGHFDITIVSSRFAGVSLVRRHRMIYEALGDLLETDIHALRIKATAARKCQSP